ncbi:ribosome assembly factor SBDS [Candidatus Micrarchaeota archaeon]|nr:ribosome assembly factor SBDS [Candidatus Micrarchaeota archaeon]
MVSLDNALIAHYDKDNVRFEIFVDAEKAYEFKEGKIKEVRQVLATDEIFKDAKNGERHKDESLIIAFGTTDPLQIAKQIITMGEVPLTTNLRRKLIEDKTNKIIAIILRESIDPRTKAPHTRVRLENALEQVKVHIDPFKSAEIQVDSVVDALKPVLPIKFKRIQIAVKVPAEYSQKSYGLLKEFGIKKEQWTNTGSLVVVIEIPAGIQMEFYDKINSFTHGNVETKVLE